MADLISNWMIFIAGLGLGVIVTVMLAKRVPQAGRRWGLWVLTTVLVAAAVWYTERRPMAVLVDPLLIFVLIGLYRQPRADKGNRGE